MKQQISTEKLLEILKQEISINGMGYYSERRKIAEEILRGRGVRF